MNLCPEGAALGNTACVIPSFGSYIYPTTVVPSAEILKMPLKGIDVVTPVCGFEIFGTDLTRSLKNLMRALSSAQTCRPQS